MKEKTQEKLTKDQIHAVALLSTGSLLEYFDRMLYVHAAIVLNDLFFPKADPLVRTFIPAFAFCSTYFLTPLGALFFGYIGDAFGRKATIVISSLIMAGCCITVTFLPTYQQIGISATVILTLCRMIQGMSGLSEITGVEIYLAESIKPPAQYPIVALVRVVQKLGSVLALCVAGFFINTKFLPQAIAKDGWRMAFLVGALIGVVGGMARRSLKEASEFADRQKFLKEQFKRADIKWSKSNPSINPKIPLSTSIAYSFAHCASPVSFYFVFLHCPEILKNTFHMTTAQIITNNLIPATLDTIASLIVALLSYKIAPLKIVRVKTTLCLVLIIFFPIAMKIWHSANTVICFQCLLAIFRFTCAPAAPVLFKYFPVLKRFRYASMLRAFASTMAYVITSFGLTIITKQFGNNGVLLVLLPIGACFAWSIVHFEKKASEVNSQRAHSEIR
jgi:MFS family permease